MMKDLTPWLGPLGFVALWLCDPLALGFANSNGNSFNLVGIRDYEGTRGYTTCTTLPSAKQRLAMFTIASPALRRLQHGAMYEVNLYIWPALYGYTGWLWGTALGWAMLITTASIALGLVVGVLMMRINPYGAELLQLCLLLVLPWFLDGSTWRWTLLVMCIVPLPRMIAGLVMGRTWT